jgi:hypothetical protein
MVVAPGLVELAGGSAPLLPVDEVGFGRIAALHHRSAALYQIN